MTMPVPCTPDSYRPFVNSDFLVTDQNGTAHPFRLEEIKAHIEDDGQSCFSLFFSHAGDTWPQQVYPIQHPQLGEFTLYLVPIRKRQNGILYEAVFNLLKDQAQ